MCRLFPVILLVLSPEEEMLGMGKNFLSLWKQKGTERSIVQIQLVISKKRTKVLFLFHTTINSSRLIRENSHTSDVFYFVIWCTFPAIQERTVLAFISRSKRENTGYEGFFATNLLFTRWGRNCYPTANCCDIAQTSLMHHHRHWKIQKFKWGSR